LENTLSEVDTELSSVFDSGAVEEVLHGKDIFEKAKDPKELLKLAHSGYQIAKPDAYETNPLEIAVKGWTYEFLKRYYPNSQTRKIVQGQYELQEKYLQQQKAQQTPEGRGKQQGGKKKKKRK